MQRRGGVKGIKVTSSSPVPDVAVLARRKSSIEEVKATTEEAKEEAKSERKAR